MKNGKELKVEEIQILALQHKMRREGCLDGDLNPISKRLEEIRKQRSRKT
jgi:hypothetical protein